MMSSMTVQSHRRQAAVVADPVLDAARVVNVTP